MLNLFNQCLTTGTSVNCGTLYAGDGGETAQAVTKTTMLVALGFYSRPRSRQVKKRKEEQHRTKTLNVSFYLFSVKGGAGTDPHLLLMRCGDIESNPGPKTQVRVDMNNVKSLQITWEDGRISWIKPYRVKISVAGLGDKVNVKWGKSKKLFPGTITGIEENNCVQESPEQSGGKNHSLEDPRDEIPHSSSREEAGNDESGSAPNCANDITLCINSTLNDVESTPLVTSGHVHQAEEMNTTPSTDQQVPVDSDSSSNNLRPRCVTCSGVFRPQYRPITCSSEPCLVLVHRQQQCSGLNREEQRSGKEWTCSAPPLQICRISARTGC